MADSALTAYLSYPQVPQTIEESSIYSYHHSVSIPEVQSYQRCLMEFNIE